MCTHYLFQLIFMLFVVFSYMNMSTPINEPTDRQHDDTTPVLTEAQKKNLGKRMKVRARNSTGEIRRDK